MIKEVFGIAGRCVSALGLLHCTRNYIIDFAATEGASMTPAIPLEGTVVVIDKISPLLLGYSKGDIVISQSPRANHMVCKRITGRAGDSIPVGRRKVQVPEGHVWLSGDNQKSSVDSSTYGPVPLPLLAGKVRLTLLPLPRILSYL